MIHNEFKGFFMGFLPDIRIVKRADKVMSDMLTFGKVVVNKFCESNTDKIGAYRMLGNTSFTHQDLSQGVQRSCEDNQGADHLLCIQDTTELNYTDHLERIGKQDEDIGPVTKKSNAGFFCHPTLVLDPKLMIPIGISAITLWNRSWDKRNKYERDYKKLPITEKESYRWLDNAEQTKSLLTRTPLLTIIGDRESDIYEEFARVPDECTHLLVRSGWNRSLYDSKMKLFETMDQCEIKHTYDLEIKGNKSRKSRLAKMSIRFTKVKLKKPRSRDLSDYPDFIEVFAVQASELPESVPDGEKPILWRLLTTHKINEKAQAIQCVEWYKTRWHIEELFRVLKSQGLQLESSQLESGAGLKKLTVMALQVALTTMTLKLAMHKAEPIDAGVVFSEEQTDFIKLLLRTIEGKTQKQKNPHPEQTLSWAAWTIARLSGWSGYKSHGPPGYISIKKGFDIFQNKYQGYKIAIELINPGDVYKD